MLGEGFSCFFFNAGIDSPLASYDFPSKLISTAGTPIKVQMYNAFMVFFKESLDMENVRP